jgi:hypothetical protein
MPSSNLPKSDHFVRHCGYQKLEIRDEEVAGVFPQAFELRPEDDGYLSGRWAEYFSGPQAERLKQTVAAMRMAGRKLAPNSALVEVKVGGILACAKDHFDRNLRVLHEPERGEGNDAYSTIRGMPTDASLDFLLQVFILNHTSITQIKVLDRPTS